MQFHVGDDHEDESSAFANFIMSIISEEVESSCIVCSLGVCFAKWLSEFGSHLTFLDEITHAGDQTLHGRSSWMILNDKLISNL